MNPETPVIKYHFKFSRYTLILLSLLLTMSCSKEVVEVNYELLKSYKRGDTIDNQNNQNTSYWIVYDEEQFEIVSDKFGYENSTMSNMLKIMELDNFDYLISENMQIERLFYDPNIKDGLMYTEEKPLQIEYSDSLTSNQIFLYKLYSPKYTYRYVF